MNDSFGLIKLGRAIGTVIDAADLLACRATKAAAKRAK
jgi:hypothetical protein